MSQYSVSKKVKIAIYIDGSSQMAGDKIKNAMRAAYGLSGDQSDIYLVDAKGVRKINILSYQKRREIEKNATGDIHISSLIEMTRQSEAYKKAYFVTQSSLSENAFANINPFTFLTKLVFCDALPAKRPAHLKGESVKILRTADYVSDVIIKDLRQDEITTQNHQKRISRVSAFGEIEKTLRDEIAKQSALLAQKAREVIDAERLAITLRHVFNQTLQDKRKAEALLAQLRGEKKKMGQKP
jgi:hypothetical protein